MSKDLESPVSNSGTAIHVNDDIKSKEELDDDIDLSMDNDTNINSNINSNNNNNSNNDNNNDNGIESNNDLFDDDSNYIYLSETPCKLETIQANNDENEMNKIPCKRFSFCSCIYEDKLYIFGGRSSKANFITVDNNLYYFDLIHRKWDIKRKPKPPNFVPNSLTGATAIIYNNRMYIFGGYNVRYSSDLLMYDFRDNIWTKKVFENGEIHPQRRWHYSMSLYKDKLYLFGGTMDRTHFNDLWEFDLKTFKWKEIIYRYDTNNKIRPRRRHKSVIYNDELYIFGGREEITSFNNSNNNNDIQLPNDILKYSFKTNEMIKRNKIDILSPINIPKAHDHSIFINEKLNELYIFGVKNSTGIVKYNLKLNRFYPINCYNNYELSGIFNLTTHHGSCMYYKKTNEIYIFGGQTKTRDISNNLFVYKLNNKPTFIKNMFYLLNYGLQTNLTDIKFYIEKTQEYIYAHKNILISRCQYFKVMFSGNYIESNEKDTIILIKNCDKKIFINLLRYFYCNELWIPKNANDIIQLLQLSDEYQIDIIKKHCNKLLKSKLNIDNLLLILKTSYHFNLNHLYQHSLDFIIANYSVCTRHGIFNKLYKEYDQHKFMRQILDDVNERIATMMHKHSQVILTSNQKSLKISDNKRRCSSINGEPPSKKKKNCI